MLLGIDLGTSSVKAALFRSDGREVAAAAVPYPTVRTGDREEQNAIDWVTAAREALSQVLPAGSPDAVGVTGQMSGLLLLDDQGQPLCPFLPWSDRRAEEGARALAARFGAQRLYVVTGCRPTGSYPAAKLWWLRGHHPAVWNRGRYLLGAREYLVMLLTGAMVTDPSAAGATQLYDIRQGCWWEPMREALQLDIQLPAVHPPWAVAGLTGGGLANLGLPKGIPVTVGAGDGACSSWGAGASRPGDVVISIGTSGVVRAFASSPLIHPAGATTCYPIGPDLYAGTGVTSAAGAALAWAAQVLGFQSVDALEEAARRVPPGSEGVLFVPDLSGARTPLWDPTARGSFRGLESRHTRAHLARAAIEGVALSLVLALQALVDAGATPVRLLLTGGGSQNTLLAETLAGLSGLPAQVSQGDAALGAAQLAAVASGQQKDLDAARHVMMPTHIRVDPVYPPDDLLGRYQEAAGLPGSTQGVKVDGTVS